MRKIKSCWSCLRKENISLPTELVKERSSTQALVTPTQALMSAYICIWLRKSPLYASKSLRITKETVQFCSQKTQKVSKTCKKVSQFFKTSQIYPPLVKKFLKNNSWCGSHLVYLHFHKKCTFVFHKSKKSFSLR